MGRLKTILVKTILILLCGLAAAAGARAQVPLPEMGGQYGTTSVSHDVVVAVDQINVLSVSSGAVSLTINAATAGSGPQDATNNGTTYSLTTNGANKKITGALDAGYAGGLSLALGLAPPTGGSSTTRTLGATSQDLVTGITKVAASGLTLTYTASATIGAAPNGGGETRTVTLTITDM